MEAGIFVHFVSHDTIGLSTAIHSNPKPETVAQALQAVRVARLCKMPRHVKLPPGWEECVRISSYNIITAFAAHAFTIVATII